jgi:hypothetical protein
MRRMSGRPLPRSLRALLCGLLAFGLAAGLFEVHSETLRAGAGSGPSVVVEMAATHAASAAHFDAAGDRDVRRCELCALLARTGTALATAPSELAPAVLVVVPAPPDAALPGGRASRGSSRGRAPPLA